MVEAPENILCDIKGDMIKESKDGKILVIPLVKRHVYGEVGRYKTIEFVVLNSSLMSLGKNKILTNVEMTEDWKYDLTPTLT